MPSCADSQLQMPPPLISSSNGVEIVAALLGHSRPSPQKNPDISILDSIFTEIIDSLRLNLPVSHQIESGSHAVSSLLNALNCSSSASTPFPNSSNSFYHHPQQVTSPLSFKHAPPTSYIHHPPQYPQQLHHPRPIHQQPIYLTPPSNQLSLTSTPSVLPSVPSSHPQPTVLAPASSHTALSVPISAQVSASSIAVPHTPRRPARKKRYHDAVPSTHCHICCRPSTAVAMAICSNIKEGTCRKVVCHRCITDNGWDWQEAISDHSKWICPHCTDNCRQVPRAQCWVYMRTNSRRRENRNKKLKMSARSGVDVKTRVARTLTAAAPIPGIGTTSQDRYTTAGPMSYPQDLSSASLRQHVGLQHVGLHHTDIQRGNL